MWKFLLAMSLLATVISPTLGVIQISPKSETAKANEYIDKIVKEVIVSDGTKLDPYHLQRELITFSGISITLSEGFISGFKSIHRSKSSTVVDNKGEYHVTSALTFDTMEMVSSASAESEDFRIDFDVKGIFTAVESELQFNFKASDDDLSFGKFQLGGKSKLELKISEESKLTCLMSAKVVKGITDKIRRAMYTDLRVFLDDVVATDIRMKMSDFHH